MGPQGDITFSDLFGPLGIREGPRIEEHRAHRDKPEERPRRHLQILNTFRLSASQGERSEQRSAVWSADARAAEVLRRTRPGDFGGQRFAGEIVA